ncbi:ribonuclease P protein component [Pseudoneobacillus rhizosphaerae]|uniref:Ribonuclease P protein component n=1 Tax=Pseudoneobacillus rhizosphaerae TaxID=2880968 RepID=A0A9C7GBD6_9BACI|nr:ribonuclease P protein component [Pseudoneobacillus rhizosphaerae]CAG9609083.1 Ribonuclease P protein component [Pseudoneobacillus rhizosphaerae]
MKKTFRIKKNAEFQEVFKKGKSVANRQFVVYSFKRTELENFKFGLSVSKKVGNSVTRNQIKRYLRQTLLELSDQIHKDVEFIIIARKPAATMNFAEIKSSMIHVLRLAMILEKNPRNLEKNRESDLKQS